MNDSRLAEFAASYTTAWCSQNPAEVAGHYAADGTLTINGGEPNTGRTALTEVAAAFMATFPDLLLEMESLVPEGDRIAYHWHLTGTNAGLEGVAGSRVSISGVERWRFNDQGLIHDSVGSFDAEDYARQMGTAHMGTT